MGTNGPARPAGAYARGMGLGLAIAALAVAIAALVVAVAALRTARRAPAPNQAAEAQAPPPAPEAPPAALAAAEEAAVRALEVAESVRRRLDLQEQRAVAPAAPETPYPRDAAGKVRAHLVGLGFEEIAVVPADASGRAFTVEGRRAGLTSKGRAVLDDDGTVAVAFAHATRVFP
jgi:hypothetical protein